MCLSCFVGLTAPVEPYHDEWMSVTPVSDSVPSCLAGFEVGEVCLGLDQPEGTPFTCACDLPSIQSDEVFPYFEGMYEEDELDRNEAANSKLIEWLTRALDVVEAVMVFPEWESDRMDGGRARGTVDLSIAELNPRELFFVDGFLYRFSR